MQRDLAPRRSGLRMSLVWLASAAILAGSVGTRAQDYLLQPGDVIEMSVAGMPEMGARSAIQMDGGLSFPAAGDIAAAGLPISQIRDRIRTAVSSKLLLMYLPDGTQVTRVVDYDQVSASVVEYRPVYVSGDITQPGEQAFRPGMTARQLIAAAGGMTAAGPIAPGYNVAQLRADYAVAWNAAIASAARVWRLQKELGQDVQFDRSAWPPSPDNDGALEKFLAVETEIFDGQAGNHLKETAFLSNQLTQMDSQTTVMQRELEAEKSVELLDANALADATDSYNRHRLTTTTLQGFRSAALFSSTRRLQTQVNLMQLERQRTEVSRENERLAEANRLDLLDQLQKASVVAAQERARVMAADEKMRLMGVAPVPPPQGGNVAQITVFRGSGAAPQTVALDGKLEPGDVITVEKQSNASAANASVAMGDGELSSTVVQ